MNKIKLNLNSLPVFTGKYITYNVFEDCFQQWETIEEARVYDFWQTPKGLDNRRYGDSRWLELTLEAAMLSYRTSLLKEAWLVTGGNIGFIESVKVKVTLMGNGEFIYFECFSYKDLIQVQNAFEINLMGGIYSDRYIFKTRSSKLLNSLVNQKERPRSRFTIVD